MTISSISINRPVLATVISILTALFIAPVAYGCDCASRPKVREAVQKAQLVVHGKVIRAELKKVLSADSVFLDSIGKLTQRRIFGARYVNEYAIVVLEGFKGAAMSDTIILRTGIDPTTDCGLIIRPGAELIIYARSVFVDHRFLGMNDGSTPAYSTSICTRTGPYSRHEAKAIRQALSVTENLYFRDQY